MKMYCIIPLILIAGLTHSGNWRNKNKFNCVADIPDPKLSSQKKSFIEFVNIDANTAVEVQIFNSDKLCSNIYPPLLFIHGFRESRWSWLSTVQCLYAKHEYISKRRAMIVVSLPGFGDSQIYDRSSEITYWSVESQAAEVIKILDYYNVPKAIYIGLSRGSFITHYSAFAYPERVESMILIGSGKSVPEIVCQTFLAVIGSLTCTDRDVIDNLYPKAQIAADISLDYANMIVKEAYKPAIETYDAALTTLCAFNQSEIYIPDLTIQTTLIWGELDNILPPDSSFVDLFENTVPNVIIIDGARHSAQWYDPEQVAQIIDDHISA